ncbi:FAD dependent oxidoreductase [Pyrolobus fumarii 1A]|uniref:FAD dependent oxidoreductase n=1 Tax=Pyrolobus fumarii (strain DSM 11204 / 1A) TaxID=694429 RepID=G0EEH2_PYRF1|nr:NAD(P)/FAD-dependent oxidoreductase [Pyrolobus fumarii]AEM38013.1 FAD dependent oxidoreductase [Pyrolobus fumarii 1A]
MYEMSEVVIIGAGPAGLLTSIHLDMDVVLLEARKRVGRPPHCTGIVSLETSRLFPREAIAEYYDGLIVVAPNAQSVYIDTRLVRLSRPLLEDILASIAASKGVKLLLGVRADSIEITENGILVKTSKGRRIRARHVVVAEGVAQRLAAKIGLIARGAKLYGLQYLIRLPRRLSDDSRPIAFILGGCAKYGWIVPLHGGRYALLGVAACSHRMSAKLTDQLRRMLGAVYVEDRRGLIPFTRPAPRPCIAYDEGMVCAIGDAVGTVKATSGGGLYAISRLAPSLAAALNKNNPSIYTNVYRGVARVLSKLYTVARLAYAHRLLTKTVIHLAGFVTGGSIALRDYDALGVLEWRRGMRSPCYESSLKRYLGRVMQAAYGSA